MSGRRSNEIERAAEAHFLIRPVLVSALKNMQFTSDGLKFVGYKYNNQYELWTGTFGDKFQDMTTMIRLGSAVEYELRNLYMEKRLYTNLSDLKGDPLYKQGAFQRIMPWQTNNGSAYDIFHKINIDIHSLPYIRDAQEVMLHRHLYAHNTGLIDDKYISDLMRLTNEDISKDVMQNKYPSEDVYWFRPLSKINDYIENLRKFIRELP